MLYRRAGLWPSFTDLDPDSVFIYLKCENYLIAIAPLCLSIKYIEPNCSYVIGLFWELEEFIMQYIYKMPLYRNDQ